MTTAKTLLAPPLGTLGLWTVEGEEEFMAGILPDAMPPPFSLSPGPSSSAPHLPLSSPPPPPPPPFAPASDSGQKSGEREKGGSLWAYTWRKDGEGKQPGGGHPYTRTCYAGFGFSLFLLRGEEKGRFKRLTSKKGGGGRKKEGRWVHCMPLCRSEGGEGMEHLSFLIPFARSLYPRPSNFPMF